MKHIYFLLVALLLFPMWVFANDIEDDSIILELDASKVEELDIDISMQSFDSCDAFEDVIEEYIKSYWENSRNNNWFWGISPEILRFSSQESIQADAPVAADSWAQAISAKWAWNDFSQTNTQVAWVDESDIVKTDGRYHYYYNQTRWAIYIVDTAQDLEVIKKINLPKSFNNIQLYVSDGRLVVIASSYSQTDFSKRGYFINRNSKTYTVVFDTTNIQKPQLVKLYSSDGSFSKSRRIGDYVYVLSRNYFNYPYYNIKSVDDIVIDAEKFLPKKLDISKTDDIDQQNLTIKDKNYPYKVSSGDIADCSSISYSLPDPDSLENTNFNPGYNIVSAINITDPEQDVKTQVIAGSNSEIYMSNSNLYMTESIWQRENYSCPPNALCPVQFFWGGTQNTLVHKLNIDRDRINYHESALIPGSPLNQYSMDEHNGKFRIITSEFSPERSTGLYVLDNNLNPVSSLTGLAPGETFRSSRFIEDKLFLVTFEQIDPLFAIDLQDPENPEVLWELKIPGFSTYLHPYDENHLIGLGYDTQLNQWWGTQTAGVKVDVYKINYDKKCWDLDLSDIQKEKCASGDHKWIIVEQLHTESFGGKWSFSEALNNPRLFVWNQDRKTLLLPATLYERDDQWRTKDYYAGLLSIWIDLQDGIELQNKTTHIDLTWLEEKRENECNKYSSTGEPTCRELLNWELYCEDTEAFRWTVPNYCFKDATIWSYVGDTSWQYNDMQIKRALYIGDTVYAISDDKITSHDWQWEDISTLDFQ